MPKPWRPTRQELEELVNNIKRQGGDTSQLESAINRTYEKPKPDSASLSRARRIYPDELTLQEYLDEKVGYLFPDGITEEILDSLTGYDRDYSIKELKVMCAEIGVSTSGDKKVLAARLLAQRRQYGG